MLDMVVNTKIGGLSNWVVVTESKLRGQPMSSGFVAYLVPTPASFGFVHTIPPQNLRGKDKIRHGLVFVGSGLKMATTDPLVHRLAGPSSGKAGLARDQTEINKIIAETSKGSKYYEVGMLSASSDR